MGPQALPSLSSGLEEGHRVGGLWVDPSGEAPILRAFQRAHEQPSRRQGRHSPSVRGGLAALRS